MKPADDLFLPRMDRIGLPEPLAVDTTLHEEPFRKLFENHNAMMMLIDSATGAIIDFNPAAAKFYGYSQARLRSMTIQEINLLPAKTVKEMLWRAASEQQDHFIFPHRLARGEMRWVEVYSSLIDLRGSPVLFEIIHDITERIEAEKALKASKERLKVAQRESEERYRDLFEQTPCAIVLHDGCHILKVNPAMASFCNLEDADEMIGTKLSDLLHPEDREILDSRIESIWKIGAAPQKELRFLRKDGNVLYAIVASGICHLHGQAVIQSIFYDVTEQKQAEAALRESEAQFRVLTETLPQMIWTADITGNVDYHNNRCAEYTGLDLQECQGMNWFRTIHPDDCERVAECWRNSYTSGAPYEIEYRARQYDGAYRWFITRALPLRDEQGKIIRWFGSRTDIQYQKELEKQLQKSNQHLHRLSKQVMTLLEEERCMISRELHDEAGQALTALRIYLKLMRDNPPQGVEQLRQQLNEAIEITTNTLEQIRKLAQTLRPPAIDTLGLNLTLEDFCREFANRSGIAIYYQGTDLPELSGAITICIYRCLQEALTNIAKHAMADRVQVRLACEAKQLSLTVRDNGVGFVWEGGQTDSNKGMGLLGMQERLDMLKGKLVIASRPLQGTLIKASIPLGE